MRDSFSSFLAGAASGLSVDVIIHPLDTIKTRIQSGYTINQSIRKGVPYAGLSAVICGSMPSSAIFFLTYENLKTGHSVLFSSIIAETMACVVRVPVEVGKQRMQNNPKLNFFTVYRDIIRHENILGLYRGFGNMLLREIPFACIQYPLWERLKRSFRDESGRNNKLDFIICGGLSGGIAGFITTPLDYVKTKIMLAEKDSKILKTNPIHVLLSTIRSEDIKRIYSGALPRTISLTIGGSIFLGIYDITKQLFSTLI